MSDIVLSAGVRQNLLALQNTAQLMSVTQNRLATGKKVNSALDNPTNYFSSQALGNRARDLNALLDSIGQAQQTLTAADKGISSLAKLVASAKSVALSARQSPQPASNQFGQITVTGSAQTETIATVTSSANTGTGAGDAGDLVITANGIDYTVAIGASQSTAQIRDAINATAGLGASGAVVASLDGSNNLVLTATSADVDFSINASSTDATTTALGLTEGAAHNSTSLLDLITAAGGTAGTATLVASVNGGSNTTITFGTGPGQVSTYAELNSALASIPGLTASVTGSVTSFVVGSSSVQNNLSLTLSTGVDTALGLASSVNQNGALVSTTGIDPTRASLQADYNVVLEQITALAKDASYNGINLLAGDSLKVVFNEKGTSTLVINGVMLDASGLGLATLSGNAFQSDATIDSTIAALDQALSTLRNQASKFGSNLNTVQARQDFTKGLINTLEVGADILVLADTNEEGANMLALQTRQQLSSTALSLSAQADQAVLRLFG